VATSAIRDTRNQKTFLDRASQAAGTPVEISSRLYLAPAHNRSIDRLKTSC
jgi:hypothetical protein